MCAHSAAELRNLLLSRRIVRQDLWLEHEEGNGLAHQILSVLVVSGEVCRASHLLRVHRCLPTLAGLTKLSEQVAKLAQLFLGTRDKLLLPLYPRLGRGSFDH